MVNIEIVLVLICYNYILFFLNGLLFLFAISITLEINKNVRATAKRREAYTEVKKGD